MSYPNLALRTADGRRSLVISHGHFTESIYTLMSRLRGILYPGQGQEPPTDIERLEEENFAWIDFFWSTLGRSGQVGTDMGMIYADLVNPQDVDAFVYNLISALLAKGKGRSWLHPVESRLLNAIFKREANRVARSERGNPTVTLSAAGQAGLQEYLEGPVRNQLRQEWGDVPEEFSFVYGHTHKPFTERRAVAGFPSAGQRRQHRRLGGGHRDPRAGSGRRRGAGQRGPGDRFAAVLPAGRRAGPGPVPAAARRRAALRLAVRARVPG